MPVVDVDRLKEQGRRFVEGFTPGQKAITLLGVVAVVIAGMTFMRWASTPNYAPLYTGLESSDAGAVSAELDAQGVDYKIESGGTIMVPKGDVYKTRINLSSKGIPNGGSEGYALLDKQGITTDQFTRNVNYQRALQGELARTIESIDTIEAASVKLTIPQQTVFVGAQEDKPTAAVVVKANGGGAIPSATVQAIAHLVASSMPNMSASEVTVVDSNGKVLNAPGIDAGGSTQVEQRQAYEAAVEKKISDMIAKTIGPNHAAVTVSAELDMSKRKETNTTHTNPVATGTLPEEERIKSTDFTGNGAGATNGRLGVGNDPNGTGNAAGGTGTQTLSEIDETRKNAIDTSVVTAETPPGEVQRLSVSVLLDSGVVADPAEVSSKWVPAITNAAGIDPTRDGNQALQVQTVAFNEEAKAAATAELAPSGANPLFDLIKHVLTILMVGLILFFAWKAIKKAEANRVPLRVPLDLRELESPAAALQPAAVGAGGGAAAIPERRSLEPPPSTLEGEITELIERQPEEVAQTLRSWLADRRS
jgi:flagellar M-ring protein FliF